MPELRLKLKVSVALGRLNQLFSKLSPSSIAPNLRWDF